MAGGPSSPRRARKGSDAPAGACPVADEEHDSAGQQRHHGYLWAELMRRTFAIDVLKCPRCGGRLRLMALIEQAGAVERIPRHLGLPTAVASRGHTGAATAG